MASLSSLELKRRLRGALLKAKERLALFFLVDGTFSGNEHCNYDVPGIFYIEVVYISSILSSVSL